MAFLVSVGVEVIVDSEARGLGSGVESTQATEGAAVATDSGRGLVDLLGVK